MNNIKNKLNIVGKCFVKNNSQNGEILSFIPDVPITCYLDDLLFILTIPDESQKFSSAYIRMQNKSAQNKPSEEIKEFTEVRSVAYIKETKNKESDILVCAPRQHVKVDLDKLVFIATIPAPDKSSAPVYIKMKRYEKNKSELGAVSSEPPQMFIGSVSDMESDQIDQIMKEIVEEQEN